MTKEKYVRITRPKLRSLFLEYNQIYFNNEVEEPEIIELWTPSKYCVGWVRATWHNKERRHVQPVLCAYVSYPDGKKTIFY